MAIHKEKDNDKDKYEKMFWAKHHENKLLKQEILNLKQELLHLKLKLKNNNLIDNIFFGKIIYINYKKKFGRIKENNTQNIYYFGKKNDSLDFIDIKEGLVYKFKITQSENPHFEYQAYLVNTHNELDNNNIDKHIQLINEYNKRSSFFSIF